MFRGAIFWCSDCGMLSHLVNLGDPHPNIWVDTSGCEQFGSSDLPRRCTEAVGRSRFMGTGHSLASLDPREILCFSSLYNSQYRPAKAICAPVELNGTAALELRRVVHIIHIHSVEACMPSNQDNSPWKDGSRTPHRISEVLNLTMFVNNRQCPNNCHTFSGGPTVFKTRWTPTSGYFEFCRII
ncbi:hypothetical protein PABG_03472 [Paracoccidioides brasiliensis Pb03]|nr:hypothetical protein PABG_03472 [Paracoccidioides brasiliensis Pb03]